MNRDTSLLFNSNESVRTTYRAQLWLYVLGAPFIALIQYSPNLAVKTFNADAWVPMLAALVPASHLLAIFFTRSIAKSDKTSWVVRPMIISNVMFFLLIFVGRDQGAFFALVVILGYILRAPIISAQSAIFRMNYPPTIRSFALSVPMAFQMLGISAYALICGRLFDISENWVVPTFILAAVLGIIGAWKFRPVRAIQAPAVDPKLQPEPKPSSGLGIIEQLGALRKNPGFFRFQLAYMFFGSGFVAIMAVLPFYLKAEFDASHSEATTAINTIPSIAIALTLPLWGRLLDRHNPVVMRTVINGIWSLTPLLLFFATSIKGVYLAQLIQGLVWSGSILIWWLGVNYYARAHEVADLMSLHQTLTGLRGIVTPFFGKWIGDVYGYKESMLFWFALMLIGFFIMLDEVRREKKLGRLRSFSETEATMDQEPFEEVKPAAKAADTA